MSYKFVFNTATFRIEVAMADVTYAEALQVEAEELSHKDSDGNAIEVGSLVRLKVGLVEPAFSWEHDTNVEYRPFDFGTVDSLNENGTVEVYWDSAGCSCTGTRTENPTDLVVTTLSEFEAFHSGKSYGYVQGQKDAQRDIRNALGLSESAADNSN